MKYLFFDIECSNCFGRQHKICEIGYVLVDENFNVIIKEDIPISPGSKNNKSDRFDESIYKREPGFEWAYEFEYYFSQPKFYVFYDRLKKLFEDKETLVFGYSVKNDIQFLNSEFKRYKLKPFNFLVCDIQKIMSYYFEKHEKFIGLQDAFKKLCPINEWISLNPHLSCDDAYMSMRVLEEILMKLKLSVDDIINICEGAVFDVKSYLEKYEIKRNEKIENSKSKKALKECQKLWGDFYRLYSDKLEFESSKGKIVTISSQLKLDMKTLKDVIEYIKHKDYIASDSLLKSDFIIVLDEEDKERLLKIFKYPFYGKFIIYSELMMNE